MPVVIEERRKSRQFMASDADPANSSGTLLYTARGSWDEAEVLAACRALVPLQPKKPGDPQYGFETSAANHHVTVSKETVDSGLVADASVYAPDLGGAVGVSGDSVDGVDVRVPTFSFSETHYLDPALVTPAYKLVLFGLTARTNQLPWHGLELGEVLFLGAQGSIRGTDFWEISYKFECSANAEDIPIPGTDETIDFKYGWDYLWFRFSEGVGTAGDGTKFFVRKPVSYYIERLYEGGDLTLLGLGT
jgi:hypothetical protein